MGGGVLVNLVLLLLLAAGPVAAVIGVVNRLHARPIRERILVRVRHVHFALILAIATGLVWGLGLTGPGLLAGGRWSDLTTGARLVVAACAASGVAWLAILVARRLRPPVPFRAELRRTRIDVAAKLSQRPVAAGLKGRVAGLPFNEMLLLDADEKTYRHPRLPREWDGLSILHLSDLHLTGTVSRAWFEQVAAEVRARPADLVVLTGDLLDDPALLDWLPAILGGWTAPLGCWFVLGNHDHERDGGLDPDLIRRTVVECGWRDAAGRCETIVHRGRTLTIGGTEQPWSGAAPPFPPPRSDDFRILVSHTPDHVAWARTQAVDLMLAGHVHGGQIVLPVLGPVYCPSAYGCRYHGGDYWEPPVLLHVSRGVSAQEPLRWRCLPEVTRIVLRAPGS